MSHLVLSLVVQLSLTFGLAGLLCLWVLALNGSILSADAKVHGPLHKLNLGATSEVEE